MVRADWGAKVPGLGIAVAVDGALVWAQAFGYADLATRLPVCLTTRFRIGSVSKPLTAAGLALLVERGQLNLDAPVQTYLPDFPEKGAVITTRLLAGHLSGIRNYRGREILSTKPFNSLRAGLKLFEDDPLESPPGTKFSYCSYNYNVIGAIMEAVTQQSFLDFMEKNVIGPANLAHTCADHGGDPDASVARFYETQATGKYLMAPSVDHSYKWPAGGFLSTAEDLARFGSALLQAGLLKPASRQLLFTPQGTKDGTPTGYGIGWFVEPEFVHHGGDSVGGASILLLHPGSRTVVAITSNGSQLLLRTLIRQGKVSRQARQSLLDKTAVAKRVARIFASLSLSPAAQQANGNRDRR